jgi:hypothetical protein
VKRRSAFAKDPVSCALISGLQRSIRRWPSWVGAYVSGTNLSGALEERLLFAAVRSVIGIAARRQIDAYQAIRAVLRGEFVILPG